MKKDNPFFEEKLSNISFTAIVPTIAVKEFFAQLSFKKARTLLLHKMAAFFGNDDVNGKIEPAAWELIVN